MFSYIAIGLGVALWACYLIFFVVIGGISILGNK
jgi:hypothetical protein